MKIVRTEIIIDACAEKIWSVLNDFDSYPLWNPFIKKISGEGRMHGRLHAFIQPPGQKGMSFKPVIQVFEPNKELQWLGKLWVSGLFDGKHSFKLVPLEPGKTLLIHSEQFTGILVPLLWNSLQAPTIKGFQQMNEELKKRAEAL